MATSNPIEKFIKYLKFQYDVHGTRIFTPPIIYNITERIRLLFDNPFENNSVENITFPESIDKKVKEVTEFICNIHAHYGLWSETTFDLIREKLYYMLNQQKQKEVFMLITNNMIKPYYQPEISMKQSILDGLILSTLGARICYSEEHPIKLYFEDKRINGASMDEATLKERQEFLTRLATKKHFSIFGHSPKFIIVYNQLPYMPYKSFYYPYKPITGREEHHYLLTARHLIEGHVYGLVGATCFGITLRDLINDLTNPDDFTKPVAYDCSTEDMIEITENNYKDFDDETKSQIFCLVIDRKPWQWFSFIIHNCSLVFTHQLVRHTFLNFSQRSYRYTKADDLFVMPSSLQNTEISEFCSNAANLYQKLIETYNIKREDARYILPVGKATTIMASGPRFVWEDFVEKRAIPQAQKEIRTFAFKVKNILDYFS